MTRETASAARSFASIAPVRQPSSFARARPEVGDALARRAGALLVRVAAVRLELVHRAAGEPGDDPLERVGVERRPAGLAALLVPGRVAVVAVHELGADAPDLARGARRLHVAEVGEEADRAGERVAEHRAALLGEPHDVEDLHPRRHEPGERVGELEGHALARRGDELVAVRVGRALEVAVGPLPQVHRRGERAGAGARDARRDVAELADPRLHLREEERVRPSSPRSGGAAPPPAPRRWPRAARPSTSARGSRGSPR